jgi:carboxyl-terminal processing protease
MYRAAPPRGFVLPASTPLLPNCFETVTRRRTARRRACLPVVVVLLGACAAACARPPAGASGAPSPAPDRPPVPAIAPAATFDSAWHIIARTHWDTTFNGVDWRALRDSLRPRAAAARTQDALRAVLHQLVSALGQSHFAVLPGEGTTLAEPAGGATGERDGTTGLEVRWVDSAYVVTRIRAGSPADRAGLRAGVRLVAVDGVALRPPADADGRREPRHLALEAFRTAERRLRGPVGSAVRLRVAPPAGRPRDVTLARVVPDGVATRFGQLPTQYAELDWERRLVAGRRVGVIRFNVWMPVLARAFDVALDSLRGADALVLDLRGNFGGVAGMAMGIAGHLVDSAVPVGVMTMRTQTIRFTINPRRVNTAAERVTPFAGPVALVVDALSASTTEIFAGGLQDLARARVFGERTAGQALPAVAERLPNGDVLYHAIADFRSPGGRALEGDGVTPDELVPATRAALAAGRDPALDRAVTWAAGASRPPDGTARPERPL